MSSEKSSVLRAIINDVYECKDVTSAFDKVKKHLEASKLPDGFKKLMIFQARECDTLVRLQKYITNSFLKYEGMGTTRRFSNY